MLQTQKLHYTTAGLAWILCETILLLHTLLEQPKQAKLILSRSTATTDRKPLLQPKSGTASTSGQICYSSLQLHNLQHNNGNLTLTKPTAISATPQSFWHKHDLFCLIFGISEKSLKRIMKQSGCKQNKIIVTAFHSAINCITSETYGTNFTAQEILVSEINSQVTPKAPDWINRVPHLAAKKMKTRYSNSYG